MIFFELVIVQNKIKHPNKAKGRVIRGRREERLNGFILMTK